MDAIFLGGFMGLVVGTLVAVTVNSAQSSADHRAKMTYYDTIKAVRNLKDAILRAERRIATKDKVFVLTEESTPGQTYWMVPRDILLPLVDIDDKYNGHPLTSELLNKEAEEDRARKAVAQPTPTTER